MTNNNGVFTLSKEDFRLVNKQKALTKAINEKFVQVGAVFLKPASKFPIDDDWFKVTKGTTDLQAWIDDPAHQPLNGGFNLQFGWTDVDIDSPDPNYNWLMISALQFLGVDTRFRFGRASVKFPTHVLVQVNEEEAKNYEFLKRFEPREIRIKGARHHTQLRSYGDDATSKEAKQTVVPGSVYTPKESSKGEYDLSVWYTTSNTVAENAKEIATTTPRVTTFHSLVRAVAFATIAYTLRDHWVSGSRQVTATKLTGWLARVVRDSKAMAEHENISREVFCPIDTDELAEGLIKFICGVFEDDEPHMRVRAYHDACEKLDRNPDAKVPGWLSMTELVGADGVQALRTVIAPGADVSQLTKIAERYIYDETDNHYIDRTRHAIQSRYVHEGAELERRHKGDIIFLGGKPREAFKVFESSNIRKRVDFRDMYPDERAGAIFRIDQMGRIIPDEDEAVASTIFNTWQGWQVDPIDKIDPAVMAQVVAFIDKMFALLTSNNEAQSEWLKDWMAWTRQYPGTKQQIAAVFVGGQGVGKSFWGNVFAKALYGSRLWGTISPKIVEDKFNIAPFIDKMFTFLDEATFNPNNGAVEEIKKLIRNTEISGMQKFEDARPYRIFARLAFASNVMNINVSQRNVEDRALFYIRATSAQSKGMTEAQFKSWAFGLKPFYDDFNKKLQDPTFLRHVIRYFVDRNVDRYAVESLAYSSGQDEDVLKSNMSWARRCAKSIIESGYVTDVSLSIETPFDMATFARRVADESKLLGFHNLSPDAVYSEVKLTQLVQEYTEKNGRRMLRFARKWGDLIEAYEGVIGVKLSPYRVPDEDDAGVNELTLDDQPAKRRGRHGTVTSF